MICLNTLIEMSNTNSNFISSTLDAVTDRQALVLQNRFDTMRRRRKNVGSTNGTNNDGKNLSVLGRRKISSTNVKKQGLMSIVFLLLDLYIYYLQNTESCLN